MPPPLSGDPPSIPAGRVRLRPMLMVDWPAYRDLMMSERALYMGGPFTQATAWGLFCADHAQWGLLGHGGLMIERCEDERAVGQVAINAGPLFPEHELGWLVFQHAEGQGHAFEAASALRDWARQTLKLPSLVSYVDPANLRSRRLAERLGARPDEAAVKQDEGDLVFRHW